MYNFITYCLFFWYNIRRFFFFSFWCVFLLIHFYHLTHENPWTDHEISINIKWKILMNLKSLLNVKQTEDKVMALNEIQELNLNQIRKQLITTCTMWFLQYFCLLHMSIKNKLIRTWFFFSKSWSSSFSSLFQ